MSNRFCDFIMLYSGNHCRNSGALGNPAAKGLSGFPRAYGWIGRKLQLIALDFSRDRFGKFTPKYYDARVFVGRRMMLYIILDFFL